MCSNAQRDPKWHPPPELHRKQILEVGTPEACAAAVAVRALNRVDLPTLGRPTMPQLKPMLTNPVSAMRLWS